MQERSMSSDAYICDGLRTPFGRYAGSLSSVRADALGAMPMRGCMVKYKNVDSGSVDVVLLGRYYLAGKDTRNVSGISGLLAGLPDAVPGMTLIRVCAASLDAVGTDVRAI